MEGIDLDATYRIFQPSPGRLALSKGRTALGNFSYQTALSIACDVLSSLGWEEGEQSGLKVGVREPRPVPPGGMESALRTVRAAGVSVPVALHRRPALWGPWTQITRPAALTAANPNPVMDESMSHPRPQMARQARAAAREQVRDLVERGLITKELFPDARQQLAYEIHHLYLHLVPHAQRPMYPWTDTYTLLPTFMSDLTSHGSALSRGQMLAAIVDVISRKVWENKSRQVRALRVGRGETNPLQVRREWDGALAWRANVSTGTPSARRIMWWVRPDGGVDLARLAIHDDYEMPEK